MFNMKKIYYVDENMKINLKILIFIILITSLSILSFACSIQSRLPENTNNETIINESVKDTEDIEQTTKTETEDLEIEVNKNIISWEKAKEFDGQIITVTGPIVKYFYSEGWEFTSLSIGTPDEGGVKVVIYDQDSLGFPEDMESYYLGKVVNVTGEILYRSVSDASDIIINKPGQIEVISENENNTISDDSEKTTTTTEHAIISTSEEEYILNFYKHIQNWSETSERMAGYFKNPKFGNESWIVGVAREIVIQQMLIDEVKVWTPPKKFEKLNSKYLEAMLENEKAVKIIPNAVDNLDVEEFNKASQYIKNGNILLKECIDLAKAIIEEY